MTLAGKKTRQEIIEQVAALVDTSGIDLEQVGGLEQVKLYQGFYKDADGVAHKVDMTAVQLAPSWASGPEWPVVQPAKPTIVKHTSAKRATTTSSRKTTVLLPDPQIGFWRYDDGTLVPMHDEQAMDCSLSLIDDIRPNRIVNMGDYLDLAEWSSKFAVLPEFVQVTQPALDRGHLFLAEQQAAAGPGLDEHELLEGNHDDRISRLIMQNAKAALRLRQAGEPPDSWPVMSIPHLLNLDKLGVTYVGGYPAGRIKLADAHGRQTPLYALHGERIDVAKQAKDERQSTVQGHAHHVALHTKTYEVDDRPQEVEAWSIGCLCRLDGAVPSTKGGADSHGKHFQRNEAWQQAIGVLTETEDGWDMECVRIRDGRAVWRGKTYGSGLAVAA